MKVAMKATIQPPVERMVTLEMTEDEAKQLWRLVYNTDDLRYPIVRKVFTALSEIL